MRQPDRIHLNCRVSFKARRLARVTTALLPQGKTSQGATAGFGVVAARIQSHKHALIGTADLGLRLLAVHAKP